MQLPSDHTRWLVAGGAVAVAAAPVLMYLAVRAKDRMARSPPSLRNVPAPPVTDHGVCLRQGRRPYMEDRHAVVLDVVGRDEPDDDATFQTHGLAAVAAKWSNARSFIMYALFDGHGGPYAAEFAAKEFGRILRVNLRASLADPCAALTASFTQCDDEFISLHRTRHRQGTTALALLYEPAARTLHVANAGDCRAVLCRGGVAMRLTEDHKPDVPSEKARIQAAGGIVGLDPQNPGCKTPRIYTTRGGGGLAVSRGLGDAFLKNVPGRTPVGNHSLVIPTPECDSVALTLPGHTADDGPSLVEDRFVILASDGVWDVVSDQEAVDVVACVLAAPHQHTQHDDAPVSPARAAANALVGYAYHRGSGDNLSAIVVVFGRDAGDTQADTVPER